MAKYQLTKNKIASEHFLHSVSDMANKLSNVQEICGIFLAGRISMEVFWAVWVMYSLSLSWKKLISIYLGLLRRHKTASKEENFSCLPKLNREVAIRNRKKIKYCVFVAHYRLFSLATAVEKNTCFVLKIAAIFSSSETIALTCF